MAGFSFEPQRGVSNKEANAAFKKGLTKIYSWYTGGFIVFDHQHAKPVFGMKIGAG